MTGLAAILCTCGHSAYWHYPGDAHAHLETQGQGRCDKCDCPKFSLARIDTYESLRGEIARLREDRATAADVEAAAEAIMASYRKFQRGDRKALERQRSTARKQARLALAAVFSEVEDG